MAREKILVNLQRCTGCWSCSLGCKMVNELADDTFRIMVHTVGNGHGTDRPAGVWPNLTMDWLPVWSKQCTSCAEGKTNHGMFCVYTCPAHALACGEAAEAEAERLKEAGFTLYELPEEENSRPNVVYARPAVMPAPAEWERFDIVEAEFVEDDGAFVPTLDGTTVGELAENPRTAGLLAQYLPWLDITTPEGAMSKGMTLSALAPFTQGLLDDDTLAAIDDEFGKIAAGYFKVDETTIGELAENPVGAALLAEFLPWLDLTTEQGAMSKGMSLAAMAPFTQGLLDDDTLATIAGRLAQYAPKPVFNVAETLIGDIAENADGAAILAKHIPWLDVTTPEGAMSKGMTLAAMAPFTQGLLGDDTLAALQADFEALAAGTLGGGEEANAEEAPASEEAAAGAPAGRGKSYSIQSKIRDLEQDPMAWAVLAKYMPGFEAGSKEAKQAGSMSIKMMAKFAKDILTPEVLDQIDAELKALGGSGAVSEEAPKKKGFFARLFGK